MEAKADCPTLAPKKLPCQKKRFQWTSFREMEAHSKVCAIASGKWLVHNSENSHCRNTLRLPHFRKTGVVSKRRMTADGMGHIVLKCEKPIGVVCNFRPSSCIMKTELFSDIGVEVREWVVHLTLTSNNAVKPCFTEPWRLKHCVKCVWKLE